MQKAIQDLIKRISSEGMNKDQIALYLQGAFDGMSSFSANLQDNKLEVQSKENDPLFIHTWNHVISLLTERMEEMIQQALKGIPKDLGVTYVNIAGRNTSSNPVDEGLPTKDSTKK